MSTPQYTGKTTTLFTQQDKKVLFLSSLGGVLEFYDFIIYIFLSPFIEKLFFASSSAYIATLKTLAVFSVGYLVRPIGGIIFSHYGDRYGRKVVFLLTVLFMAIPSFAIGLLPSTAQIGMSAPILLLILRMMQGLALGGEIPAAITFVSEHVPEKRRGFALSTLFFGINTGLLLGSLTTTVLTTLLSTEEVLAYGWRIPFILGGFFGIASIFLRRHLQETPAFKALKLQGIQSLPLVTLVRHSFSNVIQGFFLVAMGTTTVFFYLYWPQYLSQYMHYDFSTLMRVNTGSTLILNVTILIGGLLADRYGYRKTFLTCGIALIIVTYPLFVLFHQHSMTAVVISYLIFSLIFGLIPSAYSAILSTLFPTSVRYSGIAMSYNLSYAIIGGLIPVGCTLAIHTFNSTFAPAFLIILIATLSCISCYWGGRIKKTSKQGILSVGVGTALQIFLLIGFLFIP